MSCNKEDVGRKDEARFRKKGPEKEEQKEINSMNFISTWNGNRVINISMIESLYISKDYYVGDAKEKFSVMASVKSHSYRLSQLFDEEADAREKLYELISLLEE